MQLCNKESATSGLFFFLEVRFNNPGSTVEQIDPTGLADGSWDLADTVVSSLVGSDVKIAALLGTMAAIWLQCLPFQYFNQFFQQVDSILLSSAR